ncbi:AfsR/SARP family transcriptional regulator [Actinomadura sp. WMMA1423]|uniref:AfsR/SARP family transcriptional regulator n=1 Tax=Actinomadura sp. WMMA1423 TaxID=2591108 RepID=UPI00143DACE0|nr:AfsR/SARP family transcriptional regulator [Actinomadura sp. WMMA1423]
MLSVGLLGPLSVFVDGSPVSLSAGRLRVLLAMLALSAGQVVSVERLATAVWADERAPGNVRRSVQTYVARLRGALGAEWIGSGPIGYVLHVDPEHVDVLRFVRVLSEASSASGTADERARLVEALDLWRGRPLEGVPSRWLQEAERPWLVERYLAALERRVDLDVRAGRHGELVVELSELTARYPLRESLWARLLVALCRSGRQADALARYEEVRARIAAELGTDPHPALKRIHADLLAMRAPSL